MALIANPYQCDVCGRAKGEGNGWLLGFELFDDLDPEATVCARIGYGIVKWSDKIARGSYHTPIHHLCSEECALKKQAGFIR